ncbi:UNVERIFIED_CONTAM: hypothetical protein K2H54_045663, partial [Gekko kuhli]
SSVRSWRIGYVKGVSPDMQRRSCYKKEPWGEVTLSVQWPKSSFAHPLPAPTPRAEDREGEASPREQETPAATRSRQCQALEAIRGVSLSGPGKYFQPCKVLFSCLHCGVMSPGGGGADMVSFSSLSR